jgi:SEC-C motif
MPGSGRNQPCPCGSGQKTKRCCRQQRGPGADQLARAHIATLCRAAIDDLADLSEDALEILSEDLIDLPGIDYSLLITLPTLIRPDLQRLRESVQDDDPDWGWDALTTVAQQIDTPQQRARRTDAIVALRDQHRIDRRHAAYALLDLNTPSTRLISASLLEAVAVSVGAHHTPGGLQIAA